MSDTESENDDWEEVVEMTLNRIQVTIDDIQSDLHTLIKVMYEKEKKECQLIDSISKALDRNDTEMIMKLLKIFTN
jgi:signal transduction histidine kinase